jgi:phage tail-like protein
MIDITEDPALAPFFKVDVGHSSLGTFLTCDGLGVEVVLEQREEGGNNVFIHQLPVRLKYSNIKLTRPVDSDSAKVAEWFAKMGGAVQRSDATITALKPGNVLQTIASWTLHGVIPVRWQGPSFGVENNKVAIETLELAHNGFLKV